MSNVILSEQNDFLNLDKIETALEYLSFMSSLKTAEDFGNSLAEVSNQKKQIIRLKIREIL